MCNNCKYKRYHSTGDCNCDCNSNCNNNNSKTGCGCNQCEECEEIKGCKTILSTSCIVYNEEESLNYLGTNPGDNLTKILTDLNSLLESFSPESVDFETLDLKCLTGITDFASFVENVADMLCTTSQDLNDLNLEYDSFVIATNNEINNLKNLSLINRSNITFTNPTSPTQAFNTLSNHLNDVMNDVKIDGIDWELCLTTTYEPVSIKEGFELILEQLCSLNSRIPANIITDTYKLKVSGLDNTEGFLNDKIILDTNTILTKTIDNTNPNDLKLKLGYSKTLEFYSFEASDFNVIETTQVGDKYKTFNISLAAPVVPPTSSGLDNLDIVNNLPTILNITSNLTNNGLDAEITFDLENQNKNLFFAGPSSTNGKPLFRAITPSDISNGIIPLSKLSNISGLKLLGNPNNASSGVEEVTLDSSFYFDPVTKILKITSPPVAISMNNQRLLGRYTTGVGPHQEISIDPSLSLSNAGVLSVTNPSAKPACWDNTWYVFTPSLITGAASNVGSTGLDYYNIENYETIGIRGLSQNYDNANFGKLKVDFAGNGHIDLNISFKAQPLVAGTFCSMVIGSNVSLLDCAETTFEDHIRSVSTTYGTSTTGGTDLAICNAYIRTISPTSQFEFILDIYFPSLDEYRFYVPLSCLVASVGH